MSISSADETLLNQWFNERDADAFKALCSRHAGMVYATCVRILRNETEAEDVVQSCFESLSGLRKRPPGPLGPWLHKVATNRALDVLKSDKRRKAREEGFFVGRDSHTEILWEDIYEFVDEAIEELPEKLRVALVAHFLEDQTHESIARREGVSRAAITQRIQRGIETVRRNLKRRGIPVTSSALGAMLATEKALAVPPSLTASLGKLAIVGIERGGWTASNWLGAPGAKATMAAVVVGLAGLTLFLARIEGQSNALTQTEAPVAGELHETEPELQASEAQTGNAENATGAVAALLDLTAQEPPDELLAASADAPIDVGADEDTPAPTSSISGHVIDKRGNAVVGAAVVVAFGRIPSPELIQPANQYRTLTDADGRFVFNEIRHDKWALVFAEADGMQGADGFMLSAGDSVEGREIVLDEGLQLLGRILSPGGTPVAGAFIEVMASMPKYLGNPRHDYTLSDDNGYFQLLYATPCLTYLMVRSTAGETLFEDVPVGEEGSIDLRLKEPAVVSGEVRFSNGDPAKGFHVHMQSPSGVTYSSAPKPLLKGTGLSYDAVTDETGHYEIVGIFPDSRYQILVRSDTDQELSPKRNLGVLDSRQTLQQDFTLRAPMRITGTVLAKGSGQPVSGVGVTIVSDAEPPIFPDPALSTLTDFEGRFEMDLTVDPGSYVVTPYYESTSVAVAAEAFGKTIHLDYGVTSETNLTLEAPFAITLRVLDQAGKPLPNVFINPTWTFEGLGLGSGKNWSTDTEGLFTWDGFAPYGSYTLDVHSGDYLAAKSAVYEGRPGEAFSEETIVLYRAAAVRGVAVDEEGIPLGETWLVLHAHTAEKAFDSMEIKTNSDGSFRTANEFPATTVRIDARAPNFSLTWSSDVLELLPGTIIDFSKIVFRETDEEDK